MIGGAILMSVKYYYQKLMFPTVKVLKNHGGKAKANQLDLIVLGELNIPKKNLKDGFRQTQFARTYLNKIGLIRIGDKKGDWILNEEFMNMPDEDIKMLINREYRELYN
jgi:hypothetical protein